MNDTSQKIIVGRCGVTYLSDSASETEEDSEPPLPPPKKGNLVRRGHLHEMTLSEPWFGLVAARLKDVEIRVMDSKRSLISIGDVIAFKSSTKGFNRILHREVVDLMIFWDFRSALEQIGLERVLPGRAKNLEEGVGIYHSIDGYRDKAKEKGVVAFVLG